MPDTKKKLIQIGLDGIIPGIYMRMLNEGVIPNLAALMEIGSYTEVYPSAPCDTGTNWTTISTGAWTGTHGGTGFHVHLPGDSLSSPVSSSLDTDLIQAEFLWDVAEREGFKCLLYDYPPSRPSTLENGIVLGGWYNPNRVGEGAASWHGTGFRDMPPTPSRIKQIMEGEESILQTPIPRPKGFSGDFNALLEQEKNNIKKFIRTLTCLKEKEKWDYLFSHLHHFDTHHHEALNFLWKNHPDYDKRKYDQSWDQMRELFKITDEMVGSIMDEFVDQDTILCIVGDHGCLPSSRIVWPGKALEQAGLTVFREDSSGKMVLDVERSKVGFYFSPPEYIWVNLKGREPDGIVECNEYEEVRNHAINALLSVRDPVNGKCPFTAVLRKEDARLLGQWGPNVGDIIFFVEPEYALVDFGLGPAYENVVGDIRELLEMGSVSQHEGGRTRHGNHHGHLPDCKMDIFSNTSIFLISGEGVRKGSKLELPRQMVDVAPTLAEALGIDKPSQSEGSLIWQFFE